MQTDKYSMAEKILHDIESIINKDDELDEFTVIPVGTFANENKSPVIHAEHNLGLESWCLRTVYDYAYQRIIAARPLIKKRKLLHDEYTSVNRLTLGALLINPDVYTFWNVRRELVIDSLLDIEFELKLTRLVLSYKSKSNEAFMYRRWLLRRFIETLKQHNKTLPLSSVYDLLINELNVCETSARKCSNNYHAWTHRIWCLQHLLPQINHDRKNDILRNELHTSEMWISKHVSEYSGFHFRHYVIERIVNSTSNLLLLELEPKYNNCINSARTILDDSMRGCAYKLYLYDLALNTQLQHMFNGHETLWYHRRRIFHQLFLMLFHTANELKLLPIKVAKMSKCSTAEICSSPIYKYLITNEKHFLNEYSTCSAAIRYSYSSSLSKRHQQWLIRILGVRLDDI